MGPEDEEDYGTPEDYEDWLERSDLEDTEENRGWYECPEDERYQYIQDHSDWWNS